MYVKLSCVSIVVCCCVIILGNNSETEGGRFRRDKRDDAMGAIEAMDLIVEEEKKGIMV
jgi:hypothetical protein